MRKLTLFLILFLVSSLWSATYYIDAVDGNDSNPGTTIWTTGTQTAIVSGDEWADQIAETNARWLMGARTMSGDDNYIAEYSIDVCGSRYIGFSPTTVTHAANVYITGY